MCIALWWLEIITPEKMTHQVTSGLGTDLFCLVEAYSHWTQWHALTWKKNKTNTWNFNWLPMQNLRGVITVPLSCRQLICVLNNFEIYLIINNLVFVFIFRRSIHTEAGQWLACVRFTERPVCSCLGLIPGSYHITPPDRASCRQWGSHYYPDCGTLESQ